MLDTLHPYYDNVEQERWLCARVHETSPPTVRFEVRPPKSWPSGLTDRVRRHFATFDLGLLYSMQAARLISGIQARLDLLLREGDPRPSVTTSGRMRNPGSGPD